MLYTLSELRGLRIRALDGDLGPVADLYFDDREWAIRYLVADTGTLLMGREVLIAPESFLKPDLEHREFPVNLNREQIRHSPDVESKPTVSREEESLLAEHYGWTVYWTPATFIPGTAIEPPEPVYPPEPLVEEEGPHLRSAREIVGYHIEATDGRIGRVSDFVVDESGWLIRYLVVGTRGILPGKKVVVEPQWVARIQWLKRSVEVRRTKEQIRNSPRWIRLNRETDLLVWNNEASRVRSRCHTPGMRLRPGIPSTK